MSNHYSTLRAIYNLAKEELNENGNIGYTLPNGKYHLFIFVDDSLGADDRWYIIEPNEVVDGAHEPIGSNTSARYNDFEELLLGCLWAIEACEYYEKEA